MGGRITRRIRISGTARVDSPHRRPHRERAANSVDRYSLVLQLVQVFPIISGAAVLVTTTWVARAFSALGLIAGTVWVLRLERRGGLGAPGHREAADPPPQSVIPARRGGVPGETAAVVLTGAVLKDGAVLGEGAVSKDGTVLMDGAVLKDGTVLAEVVYEYREINISIRLPPDPAATRRRERRVRRRETRSRPATPRGNERTALERGGERAAREIEPRDSWTPPADSVGVHDCEPSSCRGGID